MMCRATYIFTNIVIHIFCVILKLTSWGRAGPSSAKAWLKFMTELVYLANLVNLVDLVDDFFVPSIFLQGEMQVTY